MKHRAWLRVATAATALVAAHPLAAQSLASTDPQPADGEIVVTALKRETRLETTPIAISVVDGNALRDQQITQIGDLRSQVPSVTLSESPGGITGISIRGVGTSGSSQAFEQSVGLFLDGIYQPRARQYRDALFDIDQIEVVKGAQGVLFGKNTSVGAISLRTRNPRFAFGGDIEGRYETEFGTKQVQGGVDIPVGPTAAFRVAGLWEDSGGYVYNVVKGRDEPRTKRVTGRVTFFAQATPDLTVTAKVQGSHLRTVGDPFDYVAGQNPAVLRFFGVADGGLTLFQKYDNSSVLGDSFDRQNSLDLSLNVAYDLGGITLTSLSGYSAFSYSNGYDSDGTPAPLLYQLFNEKFNQFTQELRAATKGSGPLQATVGLFYLSQLDRFNTATDFFHFVSSGLDFTGDKGQNFYQSEQTYSAFGEGTLTVTGGLKATVGGRFSHDRKAGTYNHTTGPVMGTGTPPSFGFAAILSPTGSTSATIKDDSFDYTGTLSYDLTSRAVAYVSVGRGTKSGGFNNNALSLQAIPTPFFVPRERATTYEIGVKGRFWDNRAYLALSGFIVDIDSYQDSFFDATRNGFIVRSLDAKTRGAEAEFRVSPVTWLTLFGNVSYLPTARLATGERMQRAPKFTSVAGAQVQYPLGQDLALGLSGQWSHASNSLNQAPSAPGVNGTGVYDLFDARLALRFAPIGLEAFVAGKNLSDERYREFSFGGVLGAGTIGAINRPRTVTVGLRKTF